MSLRGGFRPGAGRKPGSRNKHTLARERAAQEVAQALAEVLPAAFRGDAHALLMSVYKDTEQPLDLRIEAAKAAIGYEKPKLASIDAKLEGEVKFAVAAEPLTEDEWKNTYSLGAAAGTAESAD